MVNPIVDKIIKQLNKKTLTIEDKTALVTALIAKLPALPLRETVEIGRNGIVINGKKLEPEQIINFREACIILKDNFAYKVIREQLRYLAINRAVRQAVTMDESLFSKAALWILKEEDDILDLIV